MIGAFNTKSLIVEQVIESVDASVSVHSIFDGAVPGRMMPLPLNLLAE